MTIIRFVHMNIRKILRNAFLASSVGLAASGLSAEEQQSAAAPSPFALRHFKYDFTTGDRALMGCSKDGHFVMHTANVNLEMPVKHGIPHSFAHEVGGKFLEGLWKQAVKESTYDTVPKIHHRIRSVSYTHLTLPTKRIV